MRQKLVLRATSYRDPLGWKNFRIDWIGGAFRQESNIEFFESTSYLTGLGIGYVF